MVVLTNSLSAQTWTNESEIDNWCVLGIQEASSTWPSYSNSSFESLKRIYINTEAAKTINGEMYETEPIIIKATPK
jgi:hypothetical protein